MGAVGRLGLGYAGDKIGRLNMFIITSILSGIFSYTIWPFATSFNILLVYCILWGLTSGLYYALVRYERYRFGYTDYSNSYILDFIPV